MSSRMSLWKRFRKLTLWDKLGALGSIASILGLMTVIFVPIIRSLGNGSGPDVEMTDQPERQSPTTPATGTTEYVKENTASEIIRVLEDVGPAEFDSAVGDLYLNQWVKEPGWNAWVYRLPEKVDLPEPHWEVTLIEDYTGTFIYIVTDDNSVRDLRKKDSVTVQGRIAHIVSARSIQLDTVSVTHRQLGTTAVVYEWAIRTYRGPIGYFLFACGALFVLCLFPFTRRRINALMDELFS